MTRGHGLARESVDPSLWVNQLFDQIGEVHNLSKTGMNNHWIFHETIAALLREKNTYDTVLVGWSAIPRYGFHVGLELYSVYTTLTDRDININPGVTVPGKWLQRLGDDLRKLHNDHWDILDLVKYVNVLITMHETSPDKKIFFVNTLGPWCSGYFDHKQVARPSDLNPYEQTLLQVDTRDDTEIFALYQMLHDHYDKYGGIRKSHWLNLDHSLRSMQVDHVSDTDLHPGYRSQNKFAEYLKPVLEQRLKNR